MNRMDTYDKSMADGFRAALTRRAGELREILSRETEGARVDAETAGDFKDAAAREAQSDVDEAQAEHAARELAQVQAAMRRMSEGSYGRCLDCGEPIDLRRLVAVPAAAHCADCQAAHDA